MWAKVSHCAVRLRGKSLELEVPDMFEKSANDPEFIQQFEDASQAFFGARLQWSYNRETGSVPGAPVAKSPKNGKVFEHKTDSQ